MTKSMAQQTTTADSDTVFWAGIAVAIGALGVVVTSAFYALSPVSTALPMPSPSFADALDGMITGRTTMIAAGTVGTSRM